MRRSQPRSSSRHLAPLCLPLLALLISGCVSHTRKLQKPKGPAMVLNADAAQLAASVNRANEAVQSLSATVDLQASVGGAHKGAITDYTSLRAIVLMRKPEMLRVLGQLPVVRTTAFDLVSDGKTFKLHIPSQNKVVEGKNTVTAKSPNTLLNMRPNLFSDSILPPAIGPEDQVILTTDDIVAQDPKTKKWTEERDYLLSIVQTKTPGKGPSAFHELVPKRVIRFSREDLRPIEQDTYDKDGNIETVASYGPPQSFGAEKFPGTITIKRPLEEYQIVLTVQRLVVNQPLKDDQFELEIPGGAAVQTVD